MAKTRIIVTDPMAEVRLNSVAVGGREDSYKAVEILDDSNEYQTVAIHGPDYELIPNLLAREIGQDVMSRSEFDWNHERTLWNGSIVSMQYRSDSQVEIPEIGDTMAYGLRIENSYNGNIKLRVVAMAWVLSCLNGVTHPEMFGHYTFRHDSRGENRFDIEDAVTCVQSGVKAMEAVRGKVSALSAEIFTLADLADVCNDVSFPKSNWYDILKTLSTEAPGMESGLFNGWDVYQAFTNVITHKMKGVSSLQYSDTIGRYFLDRIGA